MDPADMADRHIEEYLAQAIAAARGIYQTQSVAKGVSMHRCVECGEPIPEARRVALPGCTLCISCTEHLERRRAVHRHPMTLALGMAMAGID